MAVHTGMRPTLNPATVLGILCIAIGLVFMVVQILGFDVGRWAWPFFIIAPGLALLTVGMSSRARTAQPLSVLGSITTAVGLLLLYQNATDHWESWAYAWALLPLAGGVGQMLHGMVSDAPASVEEGRKVARTGLIMFAMGLVFFEVVLGIGQFPFALGEGSWPILLIGLGVMLLVRSLWPRQSA